jgi:hypothetical protein
MIVMKRLSLFASVAALGMGTVSMLRADRRNHSPIPNETVAQITGAAFRDGLYLGRLAAERGAEPHVAIGRWATAEDRSSFTAGYQRGYGEFLASQAAPATRMRRAE